MGLKRLILRKCIIQHKFNCQSDQKRSSTILNRLLFLENKIKLDVENPVTQYNLNKNKVLYLIFNLLFYTF